MNSKMTANLCRLLLVLVSTLFHQSAEAVAEVDRNRVLATYNLAYDSCKGVDDSTGVLAKTAADKACEQAFEALDELKLNTCHDWRSAKCRLIGGDLFRQCTCEVSHCDESSVRSHVVTPFRVCAATLWAQEREQKVTPAPTTEFIKLRSKYNKTWQVARLQRSKFRSRLNGASTSAAYSSSAAASLRAVPKGKIETVNPETGRFSCGECGRSYAYKRDLISHRSSHKTKDTHCTLCDRTYVTKNSYRKHMRIQHTAVYSIQSVAERQKWEAERPVKCEQCGKRYKSLRGLVDHLDVHNGLTTCDICKSVFGRLTALNEHKRQKHGII